jgi:hypothetical protein
MQMTVYNPQKGRLGTINAKFTDEKTTWFDNCTKRHQVSMITDFEGGLLIRECDYGYPVRIHGICRAEHRV